MIMLFNFLVLAYKPYNLKLRLSLCFYIYFILATFIRIIFVDFRSYILVIFLLIVAMFIIIPPIFLLSVSGLFCEVQKFIYVKIFRQKFIFISALNLCYNVRLELTRGHNGVLFFYNTIIF